MHRLDPMYFFWGDLSARIGRRVPHPARGRVSKWSVTKKEKPNGKKADCFQHHREHQRPTPSSSTCPRDQVLWNGQPHGTARTRRTRATGDDGRVERTACGHNDASRCIPEVSLACC